MSETSFASYGPMIIASSRRTEMILPKRGMNGKHFSRFSSHAPSTTNYRVYSTTEYNRDMEPHGDSHGVSLSGRSHTTSHTIPLDLSSVFHQSQLRSQKIGWTLPGCWVLQLLAMLGRQSRPRVFSSADGPFDVPCGQRRWMVYTVSICFSLLLWY